VSYFLGKDKKKWVSGVSTYDYVSLGEIWKGIELKVRAYGNNVEKLFYINPQTGVNEIKIRLEGAKKLEVAKDGRLKVVTEKGEVYFSKPVAYQEIAGKKKEIKVAYVVKGKEYTFKLGQYDPTRPVIIDPLLASTYLGGSDWDEALALALDGDGNVYVAGWTYSSDFPTTAGAYDASYNGYGYEDVFVSKLSSDLSTLLASTYLGGGSYDKVYALALDGQGNVYVAGYTHSSGFPTTDGAYDTSHNAYDDAFVSKLSSDLSTLLASTYLGGGSYDGALALALDGQGSVYVAGWTSSSDFPTTAGAYDTSHNGYYDVFVSKLSSDLSDLLASTFLGEGDDDYARALALDGQGNVYVAGYTHSSGFPTTDGAYDTSHNGYYDVFVSKLSSDLSTLLASTFLGGGNWDEAYALALDGDGNVYVAGYTESSDFPTTDGAYDTRLDGDGDAFVSKLSSDLSTLLASTYLGGGSYDKVYALALYGVGNVYVAGWTYSFDFPTSAGAYDTSHNDYYKS